MPHPHESADLVLKLFFTAGCAVFGVSILYFGAKRIFVSSTVVGSSQPRRQLTGPTNRRPAFNQSAAPVRNPLLRVGSRAPRAARTSGQRSLYGRVPQDTVLLFTSHIKDVSGPIMSYLPLSITKQMRDWTIKQTLDVIFRDWRENENLEKLSQEDVSDLGSFAEFSYQLAVGRSIEDLGPMEDAVYRASLKALLEHWLKYWNADGVDGPPKVAAHSRSRPHSQASAPDR